jgi:hypothetical protein
MSGFIALLGGLAMLGVVGALFFGLFTMARGGGEADARRGNRLMRWRVILQGAALALIGLAMLLAKG